MRRLDPELLSEVSLSQVVLGHVGAHALANRLQVSCHAQRFAQRNHLSQVLSLRRAIFFADKREDPMAGSANLSASVRAKVKAWIDLQPRGTQTRMAEFMGVRSPALSNYLTGKRASMRADNIGRMVKFVQEHAPSLAAQIDVQESPGQPSERTRSVTGVAIQSTPHGNPEGGHGESGDSVGLQQRLSEVEAENAALRSAIDKLADEYKALVGAIKPRKAAGDTP